MDLGIIIDRIKKDYGEEILEDFSRLNALLMDFAPDMAKERKLIIRAIREGVITQLRRGLEEEHEEKDIVTRKCVTMLMSEMWITENAARYAVNVILNMLGHMVESDSPPSIKEKESDNLYMIYVGDIKPLKSGKKVFEPSNSIALALDRSEIRDDSYLGLSRDDDRLLKYLRGETISVTSEDGLKASGMVLVGIGDYPLGFAKINGQTAKNMYPKAWRLI